MFGALVILWLGSDTELGERRADLTRWAAAHGMHAEALRPSAPPYDAALAEQVEALLEEARTTPAEQATPDALVGDTRSPRRVSPNVEEAPNAQCPIGTGSTCTSPAQRGRGEPGTNLGHEALERAEGLLLDHPELPQAPWLLAERYAIEAHALGTPDTAAATRRRELGARARQLEGARAASVGAPLAHESGLAPGSSLPAERPLVGAVPLPLITRSNDGVFIDGLALDMNAYDTKAAGVASASHAAIAPGRHHVRLARVGFAVWSGWLTLDVGTAWRVPDPTSPCSDLDLADVGTDGAAPQPAPGVRCERWAIARPSLRGGSDIAECAGSHCGPWQHAGAEPIMSRADASPETDEAAWPGWATWSLIGAGALATASIVLWQVGAFDRSEPGTEFVFTGPSAEAFRF